MKIQIEKIADKEIETIRYLSDDVLEFKFKLETPFKEKIKSFIKKVHEEGNKEIEFLDKEIKRNELDSKGTREELMMTNLTHVFNADSYFTNGQLVISLVKKNDGYEIGKHKNLNQFAGYFYNSSLMSQFSLANFYLQSYKVRTKAEIEIVKELSKVEVIRIPTVHNSEFSYIEVRYVYPFTYNFKIKEREISRTTQYNVISLDKITVEIINAIKPTILKCCRNCISFQYSGMSQSMSGGTVGYCKIIRDDLLEKSVRESITHIWNWCDGFYGNEKI